MTEKPKAFDLGLKDLAIREASDFNSWLECTNQVKSKEKYSGRIGVLTGVLLGFHEQASKHKQGEMDAFLEKQARELLKVKKEALK